MKKIILAIVVIVGIVVAFVVFNRPSATKILVVKRKYHYLVSEHVRIDVPIFINHEKKIGLLNGIYGFLEDDSTNNVIFIEDIYVAKAHQEQFENTWYYGYYLQFYLGALSGELFFENAYLRIYYNEQSLRLYLGEIFLTNDNSNDTLINLRNLSGSKDELMHLTKIQLTASDDISVSSVIVGNKEVSYQVHQNQLIINIPAEPYYYNDPFIIIKYGHYRQYLHQFDYFNHYRMLIKPLFTSYLI